MLGFSLTAESFEFSESPKGAYWAGICLAKKGAMVCPVSLVMVVEHFPSSSGWACVKTSCDRDELLSESL